MECHPCCQFWFRHVLKLFERRCLRNSWLRMTTRSRFTRPGSPKGGMVDQGLRQPEVLRVTGPSSRIPTLPDERRRLPAAPGTRYFLEKRLRARPVGVRPFLAARRPRRSINAIRCLRDRGRLCFIKSRTGNGERAGLESGPAGVDFSR